MGVVPGADSTSVGVPDARDAAPRPAATGGRSTPGGALNRALRRVDRTLGPPLLRSCGAVRRRRRLGQWRRVGLMKTVGIGDMVLLSAVVADIRRDRPDAEIVIFAGPDNAAVARLLPVARVVTLSATDPRASIRALRRQRLDALLDFGQWTRLEAVFAAASGSGFTAGFATAGHHRHFAFDATAVHRDDVSELDNFRGLTALLGVGTEAAPALRGSGVAADGLSRPYAVAHLWPGGFRSELREWPVARWRELIGRLNDAGLAVLLSGGPADVERTEAFLRDGGWARSDVRSLAGRLDLAGLVDVLAGAECVVSVNTGVMHMAAAAGARTVALNGPTSSRRWGAIGPAAVNVDSELPGCGYLNLGFEYEGRRTDCMDGISVERVLDAALEHADA